ncbi:MAG: gamma-glutamylcyclotransferase [Rhodopila sp.]
MNEALAARPPGDGAWVFAYGALLWERAFRFDEERVGTVSGLARRYCFWDESNRGTPRHRGLTLGLIPGETCSGGAVHLPADGLREALWTVWQHEMSTGYYTPRWTPVWTPEGDVAALTFLADPAHALFADSITDGDAAGILTSAVGPGGPAAAYLLALVRWLREHGVPDPHLERLQAMVAARLEAVEPLRRCSHTPPLVRQDRDHCA